MRIQLQFNASVGKLGMDPLVGQCVRDGVCPAAPLRSASSSVKLHSGLRLAWHS